MKAIACELCGQPGGVLVLQTREWRVIRVADPAFPGYYRLIWNDHVAEFTDLDVPARQRCMHAAATIESVLREALRPTKINLASFGNMVAHLHWHVIARFDWDSHFPQPVWGTVQRGVEPPAVARLAMTLEALDVRMAEALTAGDAAFDPRQPD